MIKRKIKEVQAEIKKTKEDLNAARLEGVMPKTKYYAPKFNKDTKVNLDMSMWITHNISKEERKPYKPKIESETSRLFLYNFQNLCISSICRRAILGIMLPWLLLPLFPLVCCHFYTYATTPSHKIPG